ncbi:MucR family transcriptional regulator [Thalassobaculum fulvum]|jgi:predicted transcriptional regulator|uniref:MucR family transcriptional regulator n=1 Tax=Thalassobaculum fulvum TaxID=1633335 RepID=UPI00167A6DD8|nr:MucR family transcriptional regulator [Thalassobaculum fulvum]
MSDEASRENAGSSDLLRMTTEVVAAYLGNNSVPSTQISEVISTVHDALKGLSEGGREPEPEPLKPAVPIKKSVTPEYIVCLEDGKQLKMLKRHLRTTYDMTPEEYRAKWGLPANYPMVAPNYAKQRSEFAKKIGLGKVSAKPAGRRKKSA